MEEYVTSWKASRDKSPCLVNLATKYLTATGSGVTFKRLFFKSGNLYKKMSELLPESAGK